MTRPFKLLALLPFAALAACAPAPEVSQGVISPDARRLMPVKLDEGAVVRRTDGCYYQMMEGSLTGYLSPMQDPYHEGLQICEALPQTAG